MPNTCGEHQLLRSHRPGHRHSTAVSLTETNIDNEDTGGAAGWSIADLHHHDDSGTWTPDPHGLTSQIVVKGTAVVPTVLISNTGQTADGTARAIASNGSTSRAQAFTTGAEAGGYTLNSLGIDFNNIASTTTAGGELSVTLNEDSSGDPGTALCTLADPATFSASGLHTFDAPTTDPCPTLAGEYDLLRGRRRGAGTATDAIELKVTTNADEDSGGATGWSIGNDRHWITTQWSDTTAESHLIVVKGSAVAASSRGGQQSSHRRANDQRHVARERGADRGHVGHRGRRRDNDTELPPTSGSASTV